MTTGEVALVTGANKGIGREITRRLANEGMTVYLGARDEQRGRTAEQALASDGLDVRFVQLDVTDHEQVDAAAKRIESETGRLDVLVNNAGVAVEWGVAVPDVPAELMRRAYEVNVFGVVAVTRAFVPLLRRSANGRVVNMSSPLGSLQLMSDPTSQVSAVGLLAYNSSKAAVNAMTVLYANALRDDGIRVNAANPGLVGTDLNGLSPEKDGVRTVVHGAEVPVSVALSGAGGPTGMFVGDDDFAVDGIVPW
jgi:NAD(P)-dependent dehydrogenase (short-subunit alcohol dehydrogenase family)